MFARVYRYVCMCAHSLRKSFSVVWGSVVCACVQAPLELNIIRPPQGELIGHVTMEMRLALPISELYNLFLERNPVEKEAIKQAARVHPLQDETTGTGYLYLVLRG